MFLTHDSGRIDQPEIFRQSMYMHQLTAVSKMLDMEREHSIVDDSDTDYTSTVETKLGLLCDKPGSGKTTTVAGLLSKRIKPTYFSDNFSSNNNKSLYFSKKTFSKITSENKSNLIIVKHSLFNQWKQTLELTDLSVCYVKNKKTFKDFTLNDDIAEVVLVSNTVFTSKVAHRFMHDENDCRFYWKRIILDEPQTLVMPKHFKYYCNFIWLVIATPYLCFTSTKQMFTILFGSRCYHEVNMNMLIVKSTDEYVDQSITLPPINETYVNCLTPSYLNVFSSHIPNNVVELLQAGCITEAVNALNCEAGTEENIIKSLIKNYETKLHNVNSNINYINTLIISNDERENRLKSLLEKQQDYQNKISGIRERIYKINDEVCPICVDSFTNPTATSCCQNVFCLECIVESLKYKSECPFCRCNITPDSLKTITTGETTITNNTTQEQLLNKIDALVKIVIESSENSKFLVFSKFDSTFSDIKNTLSAKNIKYEIIKGSCTSIENTIKRYKEGITKVILLNSENFGSGLNLEMTTDIIVYHKLTNDMKEQVIGRGQRIGRTTSLNVHYLSYQQEY